VVLRDKPHDLDLARGLNFDIQGVARAIERGGFVEAQRLVEDLTNDSNSSDDIRPPSPR